MSWVELLEQDSTLSRDLNARGQALRVFRVWDVPASQIILEPHTVLQSGVTGPGLPAIGSFYSNEMPFILESYDTRRDENTIIATARYSNNRRWRLRSPVDHREPNYKHDSMAPTIGSQTIEFWARRKTWIDSPSGGQVGIKWDVGRLVMPVTLTRYVIRRNLPNLTQVQKEAINAQVGNIHLITFQGGSNVQYCLFEGALIEDAGEGGAFSSGNRDYVEYRWLSDPGLPGSFSFGASTGGHTVWPDVGLSNYHPSGGHSPWPLGAPWVRPPHHTIVAVMVDNEPKFTAQIQANPEFPNGHLTLPGL